jgi:hypothetical protein
MTKLNWSQKLRHIWSTMTNRSFWSQKWNFSMTNTFFVIEVYFFYDHAKWSQNWSRKGMPRGTAHGGCWRGKARADMDMMTWLFDTAPRVALWFVHVSSSEWSTCRALVAPRFALWLVHVENDDVTHMANDITTTWQMTWQSRGRWWRQSHGCWGVHIFHSWAIKNGLILEKVIES